MAGVARITYGSWLPGRRPHAMTGAERGARPRPPWNNGGYLYAGSVIVQERRGPSTSRPASAAPVTSGRRGRRRRVGVGVEVVDPDERDLVAVFELAPTTSWAAMLGVEGFAADVAFFERSLPEDRLEMFWQLGKSRV